MANTRIPKEAIVQFVRANPGTTSSMVAKALGMSAETASAALLYNTKQAKHPELTRQLKRTRANGSPVYVYYAKDVVVPTTAPLFAPAPAPLSAPIVVPPERVSRVSDPVGDAVKSLIALVVGPLEERLEAELRRVVDALPQKVEKIVASSNVRTPHVRKKKICLVGLLPQQAGMIQQEFGGEFDFKFIGSDERNGHLTDAAKSSDVVMTMTKFVSHATEDLVRTTHQPLVRVSGGMTELRDKLTQYYVEA